MLITVQSENGTLVPGAEIFVNNKFKGKTNTYGEGKGTKIIVLSGSDNVIQVEKEGYSASLPNSLSANFHGEQRITIILEKRKTNYNIHVENQGNGIEDARVSLRKGDGIQILETDSRGDVTFEHVDDGKYRITIAKNGYELQQVEEDITFEDDGDDLHRTIELVLLPGLEVRVVDTKGTPLRFVEVSLFRKKDYNTPGNSFPLVTEYTGWDGDVEFTAVSYESYYVVVVKREDFIAQTQEKLLKPSDRSLRFAMVFDID